MCTCKHIVHMMLCVHTTWWATTACGNTSTKSHLETIGMWFQVNPLRNPWVLNAIYQEFHFLDWGGYSNQKMGYEYKSYEIGRKWDCGNGGNQQISTNLEERHVCIFYAAKSKVALNGEVQVPLGPRTSIQLYKGAIFCCHVWFRARERERERERK